jgi:FkbM family methyltransferase
MKRSNPVLSMAAWMAGWLPSPVKRALYRAQPLARLVRDGLNRAAPQGLTSVKVAAGGLRGCLLFLDLQSEKDYWLGTYEPDLQAAIADLVQPGGVAYDVGANIGYISLLLRRRLGEGGRVFAFEALPANLERLRGNLALNGLEGSVVVQDAAVIESERAVRFLVGPSGGMGKAEGSAGRQEVTYTQALDVAGISLDGFVYGHGNPPPQVIKMDIEGGEVLALPGMCRLLAEARPLLLLELHGPQAAALAWDTLISAGYRICRMQTGYPEISSLEALDWKAYVVAFPSGS